MRKTEIPMPVLVTIVAVFVIAIIGIGWTLINREPQPVAGYHSDKVPTESATGPKVYQQGQQGQGGQTAQRATGVIN